MLLNRLSKKEICGRSGACEGYSWPSFLYLWYSFFTKNLAIFHWSRLRTMKLQYVYFRNLKRKLDIPKESNGEKSIWTFGEACVRWVFNSLRQHPFFPSYSSIRSYLEIRDSFEIKVKGSSFGLRVVGYLHPPVSGYYSFHLRSYFMAQFWLSSKGPENAIKLAYATRNKLDKLAYFAGKFLPKSKRILLKEGQRYYFEILKVINSDAANVKDAIETRLEWMLPGQTSFTKIDGRRLSRYLDVSGNLSSYITPFDNLSPSLLFSDEEDKAVGPYFPPDQPPKPFMSKQFNRQNVHGLSYLDRQYTMKAFPKCKYTSRFMERKKFSGNHGVFVVAYPRVYPDDGSGSVRFTNVFKAFDKDDRHNGTIIMSKTVAQDTVASFMAGLNKTFSR